MKKFVLILIVAWACRHSIAQSSSSSMTSKMPPTILSELRSVPIGDVDSDGIIDYAASDTQDFDQVSMRYGSVRLISSAANTVISTFRGGFGNDFYGSSLAAGDFNGDGIINLVVATSHGASPRLDIINPLTNGLLMSIPAPTVLPTSNANFSTFAHHLDMKDMDGDGKAEILVCSRVSSWLPLLSYGIIHVFSGGTGTQLASLTDFSVTDFARTAEYLDDLNGDGIAEILVAAPFADQSGKIDAGFYGVYDVLTGLRLHFAFGSAAGAMLGESAAVLDDKDFDGHADIVISEGTMFPLGAKKLTLLSSLTGLPIVSASTNLGSNQTIACRDIPDVDGDGVRDLAAGVNSTSQFIEIFSGKDLRHMDRLSAASMPSGRSPGLTLMPDVDGNGFSDLLLSEYLLPGVRGPLKRITLLPVLTALAAGTHPNGACLLYVNGSEGGLARRVDLGVSEPFSISFDADPLAIGSTDFIIFGMIGLPSPSTSFSTIAGDFIITPKPANPGDPRLFTLVDSIGFDPTALFTAGPAPYLLQAPLGVPAKARFVLQGVSVTNFPAYSLTNAVLLDIN